MATKPSATAAKAAGHTPCPRCGKTIPVRGERGSCASCGLAVRFVDAEERPCNRCSKAVAFMPGAEAVRCLACEAWNAAEPSRPVEARTTCPRCGRRVAVPSDSAEAPCPRCGAIMVLEDA